MKIRNLIILYSLKYKLQKFKINKSKMINNNIIKRTKNLSK